MLIWDKIYFQNTRKISSDKHQEDTEMISDTTRWDTLDAEQSLMEKKKTLYSSAEYQLFISFISSYWVYVEWHPNWVLMRN